jgi:hypothetical protein
MPDDLETKITNDSIALLTADGSEISDTDIEEEIKKAIRIQQIIEEITTGDEASIITYDRVDDGWDSSPVYLGTTTVDYDEIFSHLGQMETQNAYENMKRSDMAAELSNSENRHHNLSDDDSSRIVQHQKYHTPGFLMSGNTGLVPPPGMSADKWENYKLMVRLDSVKEMLLWRIN